MAKKEEEVVEKEYSLQELLAHSRKVDANIVADQTQQARDAVKAQWGLIDPSEIAEQAPVVTKPATKKELADQQKAFDAEKKDLEARLLESQNANVDLSKQVQILEEKLAAAVENAQAKSSDEDAAKAAAAKLAQQSGDEPPPWLQAEQK